MGRLFKCQVRRSDGRSPLQIGLIIKSPDHDIGSPSGSGVRTRSTRFVNRTAANLTSIARLGRIYPWGLTACSRSQLMFALVYDKSQRRSHLCSSPSPLPVFIRQPFGTMTTQQDPPRVPDVKFRVLIIGRSNAGKTSILQKVCDTTESPEIYRRGPDGTRHKVCTRS